MKKEDVIEKFASKRPEALGIYGYGSGVFKQASFCDRKEISQTDLIFIVEDLKSWHLENMQLSNQDYSLMGRIHFNFCGIQKLKGMNNITYLSNILDDGIYFKYGVIEIGDYLRGLNTWDNIFVAGRFHKPVLEVKSNEEIKEAIDYNRRCALIIACLFSDEITSTFEIYRRISSLSYAGDARMRFAENPNKVFNIVNGSFDEFVLTYPLEEDFITVLDEGNIFINHQVLLDKLIELPVELLNFLIETDTDFSSLDVVRINIGIFLLMKNRKESKAQIFEGLMTNGIARSVPYALAKVKKRFGK